MTGPADSPGAGTDPKAEASHRRRFYAEEIVAVAGVDSPRLLEAFARVRREDFLGPGPWDIVRFGDGGTKEYRRTPDADLAHLLHNVVVAIDPTRQLNNGQPSALASWIHSLAIEPGDSVLHVGCGVGYYTAVIAELAKESTGIEIDPALAERARTNLAGKARVFQGDGGETHGSYDAIFINAGATHPRIEWLEALTPGGRLVVPITIPIPGGALGAGLSAGIMLEIRRGRGDGRSAEARSIGDTARFTTPVQIYDCAGARDPSLEPVLRAVLFAGKWREVRKLRRDPHDPAPSCIVHTASACLSTGV
ncbi:MAG TPA: methyltransferase domain-containing protein [Myxococcales bacterium]|jgi:protein-L-isoaspartate(D-aspartate) O-methyltransferase